MQARLTTGRAASWVPRGGTSRHKRCARGRRHGLMMPDRRQGERPAHGVAGSRQTAQRQTVPWCAALHVQVRAAPPPLAASQLAPRRGRRVRPASPQLHPRRPGHIPMDRHLARTASGKHASERSARRAYPLEDGWQVGWVRQQWPQAGAATPPRMRTHECQLWRTAGGSPPGTPARAPCTHSLSDQKPQRAACATRHRYSRTVSWAVHAYVPQPPRRVRAPALPNHVHAPAPVP